MWFIKYYISLSHFLKAETSEDLQPSSIKVL